MQLRGKLIKRCAQGLACAPCLAIPAVSAAITAGAVSALHEDLIQDKSYQFAFTSPPEIKDPPNWLRQLFELIAGLFQLLAPVFRILFWLGLALLVGGAVFFIGREIWRRIKARDKDDTLEEPPVYEPSATLTRALLEEADRLSAEGRYGDAVRVLLFRSIEDIERFHPNHVRISMTSREISELEILRSAARKAFSQIAAAVETDHFAGRAISAEIFADCRAAYHIFAEPERAS
ncbi:MAG: hypothetical protein AAGA09_07535 [Pseudomonadota bacterium]